MNTELPPTPARRALLFTPALLLWLLPAPGFACECPAGAPQEIEARSTATFEGHVVSLATGPDGGREILFRVTRSWRGPQRETLRVHTPAPTACGVELEIGAAYLVYATGAEDALRTDRCAGTRPIEQADADLARLGVGSIPVDPPAQDERRSRPPALTSPGAAGCASCTIGRMRAAPDLLLVACAAIGLLLGRRRRR